MQIKRIALLPFALLLLAMCAGLTHAAEIDDINSAIASHHARWQARETPVHKMNPANRRMRASLIMPSAASLPLASATGSVQTTLAQPLTAPVAGLDWRNFGGVNYLTPVKDQGNCGSCWAFATTAALESYQQIHAAYNTGLDLSEQIMVSCSGAGSCNGGSIDAASTFIQHTGLPTDSADLYLAANGACANAAANWQAATDKIAVWDWVVPGTVPNITTIKNALYTYGPLVTTMSVYSDFFAYGSGVYTHTGGTLAGGHAVLMVGYADDATVPGGGYFIVKNSWGAGWGENGYFRIAYAETTSACSFAKYTLAYDTAVQTCSYSLSATGGTLASAAGSGSDGVITSGCCTWSARSSDSWLTAAAAAGKGNGVVSFTASANTAATPRSATITILNASSSAAASYTVTQAAAVAPVTLSGTVRGGSSTGALLSGATVTLGGNKTASTDSNGAFSFTGVVPGSYALLATKSGYGQYLNATLAVSSNQSIAVVLPTLCTLGGAVTAGGAALSGAVVSLSGPTTATATAGVSGTYSIANLPAGTYAVSVSKTGYGSYTNSALAVASASQTLNVALALTGYTVSGTVKSTSSGNPVVSGASVSVAGKSTITAADGTFSVAGIPAGAVPVVISKTGYLTLSATLTVSGNTRVTATIMPASYTVTGTVKTLAGAPLSGATVTLGSQSATSNSSGSYSITGVAPGSYAVRVSATGYLAFTGSLSVSANRTLNLALVAVKK